MQCDQVLLIARFTTMCNQPDLKQELMACSSGTGGIISSKAVVWADSCS
jgi:hypothetical protein